MSPIIHPSIPGYSIIRHLGSGGYGAVFLSIKDGTPNPKTVAIKVLHGVDTDTLTRFKREVRTLMEVNSEHVVKVLDYNMDHTPPYFVMEYCEGGSLNDWVVNRKPLDSIVIAILHTSYGLSILHNQSGFHRDVKPLNLLLATDERVVKLADFGLARLPSPESATMTFRGLGTYVYMAPELVKGAPMSAACDIFSLGITLTELLTGSRDPLKVKEGNHPKKLVGLVQSMTAGNPDERPTITKVIEVLESIITDMTQPAARALPHPPARSPARPAAKATAPVEKKAPAGMSPLALLLFGAVAAFGLGIVAQAAANDETDDE